MPDNDPLILGQNNTASLETSLVRGGGLLPSAFRVENGFGSGILGRAQGGPSANPPDPTRRYGLWGDSAGGDGVYGASTSGHGVSGRTTDGFGVFGSSTNRVGVIGLSTNDFGVFGSSPNRAGVLASSTNGLAVAGQSTNGPGAVGLSTNNYGVWGVSDNTYGVAGRSTNSVGVFGLSTNGLAGQFAGDVNVTGRLFANKSFRIDHPLDPQNKYLQHACVESLEMKNLYDGVVELDEGGAAWVELPEWFKELNRDLRYQLTAIGAAAPQLHIAEEVSEEENRFKVAGGEAGMKVSWQVTGIRKDRWAQANPLEVEEDKSTEEQGRYLHPLLYDQSEGSGIALYQPEEQLRQLEQERQRLEQAQQRLEQELPEETT